MLTVVSVTKEKGPGYTVTFSNDESYLVAEEVLIRHRLLKNQTITPETLAQIRQENQIELGYQMSLHYLSFQLRTQKEVRDYLRDKEINPTDVKAVIKRLEEVKLLDDLVYAQSYLRTQMRLSDKGPFVLEQNLLKKGVKKSVIEEALTVYPFEQQVEVATRLAQKSVKKLNNKSHSFKRQKMQQILMTKGFNSEVASVVLAGLTIEKDDEQETELLVRQADKLWQKAARFDKQKQEQKVIQGLLARGFDYSAIQHYLSQKRE